MQPIHIEVVSNQKIHLCIMCIGGSTQHTEETIYGKM